MGLFTDRQLEGSRTMIFNRFIIPCSSYLCVLCASAVLFFPSLISAEQPLILYSISIEKDTVSLEKAHIILLFNGPPSSFPVYALARPQRIVADLTNTTLKKGLQIPASQFQVLEKITADEKTILEEPNVRVEITLKQNVRYTASLQGPRLIITLNLAGDTKQTMSVFTPGNESSSAATITSMDVTAMEKSVEIAVGFTKLPQTASVYLMEDPPRIVMDFYGVAPPSTPAKMVNISPVKSISIIKRQEDSLYTGVVVQIERVLPFRYQQLGDKMIVSIPTSGGDLLSTKNLWYIGGGVLIAGGVAAGVLLGKGNKENKPEGATDLGKPPPLPAD
jgi:hypothetical protein